MFQISSSPSRQKATSALAVLAAMGASGMASRSDAATTEYAPTQSAWTNNSAYAYLGGNSHWLDFLTIPVDANDSPNRSISGAGGTYGPARAWFDWSLPGLGTSFGVSQATLKLQALGGNYGFLPGRTVSFGLITDAWDSTLPPNDPANNSPGAWNATGSDGNGPNLVNAAGNSDPASLPTYNVTTAGGLFELDATALMQAWAANPSLYRGIGVYSRDIGPGDSTPGTADYGAIYTPNPNSPDFPAITGHLILDQMTLGPTSATWSSADAGDWQSAGNWTGGIPNGVGHEAKFLGAIGGNKTVFTDADVTLTTLRFDNANTYNISGNGKLTMEASTGSALIEVLNGTQKINLELVIASPTNVSVAPGKTLKISDPVTVNSGASITPTNTGAIIYESTVTLLPSASIAFNSSQHLAALTVGDNATATVQESGSRVLEADSLSISSTGGKVDLKDNKMLFRGQGAGSWNGSAYEGVSGLVASGKLTTSMPEAADLLTALAVRTTGSDTQVVYSYVGDTDIDGLVDGDDFAAIDAGFSANLKGYVNGDLNYSGKIDADDYWLIDRAYSKQTSPFGPAAIVDGMSAVPEPASAGVLGTCLAAMLMRRRRRV